VTKIREKKLLTHLNTVVYFILTEPLYVFQLISMVEVALISLFYV